MLLRGRRARPAGREALLAGNCRGSAVPVGAWLGRLLPDLLGWPGAGQSAEGNTGEQESACRGAGGEEAPKQPLPSRELASCCGNQRCHSFVPGRTQGLQLLSRRGAHLGADLQQGI